MPIIRTGYGLQVYRRFELTVIDSLLSNYDIRTALWVYVSHSPAFLFAVNFCTMTRRPDTQYNTLATTFLSTLSSSHNSSVPGPNSPSAGEFSGRVFDRAFHIDQFEVIYSSPE